LGCADTATALECLRRLPVNSLLPHTRMFMSYAYGNDVLPSNPADAVRQGRVHPVPVISGATRHEHRLFVGLFYELAGQPVTAAGYPRLLSAAFGSKAQAIAREYPVTEFPSPATAWADILTDRMWASATLEQHEGLARHGPVYAYEFADAGAPMYLPFPSNFPAGAFHASDVPYLFADEKAEGSLTPAQRALSAQMIGYWTQFARTGDPNHEGAPRWPAFGGATSVLGLAPGAGGIAPVDYAAEHRLAFWSGLR
jgi:para-nitrobenzyl esterase